MIIYKKIKCPYKEPPVFIMDMHVHISERWFLNDLLHKVYGRATPPRDIRELKKYISYSIAGKGKTQLISSEHAL